MANIAYTLTNGAYNLSNSVYIAYLQNYLWDDWDDNAFARPRTSQEDGSYRGQDGTLYSDARYRPDWTVNSGSVTASSGVLQLPSDGTTRQEVSTSSSFHTGSWAYDNKISANNSNFAGNNIYVTHQDSSNWIRHQKVDSGSSDYQLQKKNGGTKTNLILTTWTVDTNWHTEEITRDTNGNWELLHDGTSKGTATDTFLPTVNNLMFNDKANDSTTKSIDNFTIQ